ncbi:MAG: putative 2OG-Fe(II) oxygenase [Gammaproteobacteria bacterium]
MARPTQTIQAMFATPFVQVQMPDAAPLLAELRALFLARETDEYRYPLERATQRGVYESRFDLFKWDDAPVKKMVAFCHGTLSSVVMRINQYTEAEMDKLDFHYEAWFHVTRTGGFQGLHIHPNASWSGIICVDPGDSPEDADYSGVVRYHDPRLHITMHEDAGNRQLVPPFTTGGYDVRHAPGQLIVMPSYLHHEIFPYMGKRPRIVVAFNCAITRKP